jgi:indolepyruvate ferredoxin oxidoreductase alpha subunit
MLEKREIFLMVLLKQVMVDLIRQFLKQVFFIIGIFIKLAFEVSEKFDTPVMVRSVTRVSHAKGIVELQDPVIPPVPIEIKKDTAKYTMLPSYARIRHAFIEERLLKLKEFAEQFPGNRMEINDPTIGIISAGISYQYAKEVFPNYSYLKLGMVWPLPNNLIGEFFKKVKKVYIVEELDPFLEENIRAMGFKPKGGKNLFSLCGELNPFLVEKGMLKKKFIKSVNHDIDCKTDNRRRRKIGSDAGSRLRYAGKWSEN